MLALGDVVQHLSDVAQVGEPTLAADLGEHPSGQPAGRGGLQHGRDAAASCDVGPAPHGVGHLVGEAVAALVELARGQSHEAGQRRGPHPGTAVRLLERLEQGEPLDGGGGREHAATPRDHGRDAELVQGRAGSARSACR